MPTGTDYQVFDSTGELLYSTDNLDEAEHYIDKYADATCSIQTPQGV